MDPTRLPHAPYPLARDPQTACYSPLAQGPRTDRGSAHDALVTQNRPEIREHLTWLLVEESRLRWQGWLN